MSICDISNLPEVAAKKVRTLGHLSRLHNHLCCQDFVDDDLTIIIVMFWYRIDSSAECGN